MSFDGGVFVVVGFGITFRPGLDVGEMDVWTEFLCLRGVDMSSYAEFSSRTTFRLQYT